MGNFLRSVDEDAKRVLDYLGINEKGLTKVVITIEVDCAVKVKTEKFVTILGMNTGMKLKREKRIKNNV